MVRGVLLVIAACGSQRPAPAPVPVPPAPPAIASERGLRAPSEFASITDRVERSRALFGELAVVLTSPRCVNCHTPDDSPRQGDASILHDPPVARGSLDRGVVGMQCTGCHQDHNLELARVPGAPGWHLAPLSMVWLDRTPAQICEQIKDSTRNGGRTLAQIQTHVATDLLIAWGWAPGADRKPAPGTQQLAGALAQAWIESGAECP
ncbi:MAG: Isoquinoline 1-oxidoreductase subunit [Kofleriaceae bacterium]